MRTAKELLLSYLQDVSDVAQVIELFADDARLELPYFKSAGIPWQWQGKEVIHEFLQSLATTFIGFEFQQAVICIDTPEQVFAEYEVHCRVAATNKPYDQLYMGRLVAENGKIKLLREAADISQLRAFSPDNAA